MPGRERSKPSRPGTREATLLGVDHLFGVCQRIFDIRHATLLGGLQAFFEARLVDAEDGPQVYAILEEIAASDAVLVG